MNAPLASEGPTGGQRRRPKDRGEQILRAAAELFRERGYHPVGIDDIGEAVGITGPAVYRHFPSKEALLVAAVDQAVDRAIDVTTAVIGAGLPPREALDKIVAETVGLNLAHREFFAAYTREFRNLPSDERRRIRSKAVDGNRLAVQLLHEIRPELSVAECEFRLESVNGIFIGVDLFETSMPKVRIARHLHRMILAALLVETPERLPEHLTPGSAPDRDTTVEAPRREQILTSAAELFHRHGYEGVGIDDIGAAAGISGPAVYRHFANKNELLLAVLRRAGEALQAGATAALQHSTGAEDAVARLVHAHAEAIREMPHFAAVHMYHGSSVTGEGVDEVRRYKQAYLTTWVQTLAAAVPGIASDDARIITHGGIGLLHDHLGFPHLGQRYEGPLREAMARAALLSST